MPGRKLGERELSQSAALAADVEPIRSGEQHSLSADYFYGRLGDNTIPE
jgi:hypothetical protein